MDDDEYDTEAFYQSYEPADGRLRRKLGDGSYETVDTTANGILQERHDERLVRILDSVTMATEISRLSIVLPEAAIIADRANDVKLHSRAWVHGHDAYGVLRGVPVYDTYDGAHMNADLAAYLEPAENANVSFAGRFPADFFVAEPPVRMPACGTEERSVDRLHALAVMNEGTGLQLLYRLPDLGG